MPPRRPDNTSPKLIWYLPSMAVLCHRLPVVSPEARALSSQKERFQVQISPLSQLKQRSIFPFFPFQYSIKALSQGKSFGMLVYQQKIQYPTQMEKLESKKSHCTKQIIKPQLSMPGHQIKLYLPIFPLEYKFSNSELKIIKK